MSRFGAAGQTLYRVLTWLLAPAVLAHLLWRSYHDGGWIYLQQRLGFGQPDTGGRTHLWVHAASVGEINTAIPLLRALLARLSGLEILITTNTPTGRAALERQLLPDTVCSYLPLDYNSCVRRFFRNHRFSCGIIMETEVWPVLYAQAQPPLVIANGRLSQRTLRVTDGILRGTFARAVGHIHTVLARSEDDAAGFIRVGVSEDRVKLIGNLKFAGTPPLTNAKPADPLVQRPYCLLASTHAGEEVELARRWLAESRNELLVIAPRHPDRSSAIEKQLSALGASVCVRSRNEPVTSNIQVYLADTLGEMQAWYEYAGAIFMGGSLVAHGGHNMLEAARQAQSVVTGPHTQNFLQEVALLHSAGAIQQVDNAEQVVAGLTRWLDNPASRKDSGQRALAVVEQHQHIVQDYVSALSEFLPELSDASR